MDFMAFNLTNLIAINFKFAIATIKLAIVTKFMVFNLTTIILHYFNS